jgi:hypothetical protein
LDNGDAGTSRFTVWKNGRKPARKGRNGRLFASKQVCEESVKKTVDTLLLLTYGSRSVIGPERVEAT